MKNLLEVMNENLGKNYKTVAEYGKDVGNVDMKIVAETLYQYMLYQEAIDNADMNTFKIRLEIMKDK